MVVIKLEISYTICARLDWDKKKIRLAHYNWLDTTHQYATIAVP